MADYVVARRLRSRRLRPVALALCSVAGAVGLWPSVTHAEYYDAGNLTVTANMGSFSPNPVQAPDAASGSPGATATSSLSATVVPVEGVPEGQVTYGYGWSIDTVEFRAAKSDSWAPASGGYAYSIIQPDSSSGSATLKFTPLVTGYWQVTTECNVTAVDNSAGYYWTGSAKAGPENLTSYTFDITYTGVAAGTNQYDQDNNTVVTGKTVDVHAGWPIQLGAELSPSDLATQFSWSIGGAGGNGSAAINGYCSDTATGTPVSSSNDGQAAVVPLNPSTDTLSAFPDPSAAGELSHYYYTESCSESVSVTPQGAGIPASKAAFSVAAPTTTLTAKYQYPVRLFVYGTGPADYIYLRETTAIGMNVLTALSQAGITFEHPPLQGTQVGASKFSGTSHFVQVYSEADSWYPIGGGNPYSAFGTGLDEADPYQGNVHFGGDDFVIDAPQRITDSVPNKVDYSTVIIDDNPTMWVMYTPALRGSIDVPVASSAWHWGVVAKWNAQTKSWDESGVAPSAAGPAPASPTDTYPAWNDILEPPNPPL